MKVRIFTLLALGLFFAPVTHAQFSRIISVELENSDASQAAFYASPFVLKVGAACTWTVVSQTATMNCAGGGAPGGNALEVQYNNAGAFGGITNLTNGLSTDCDGFGSGCQLQSTIAVGSFGLPYILLHRITGGPAGNYMSFSGSETDTNTHVFSYQDAWDGTNYASLTLHSRDGLTISPKIAWQQESGIFACVPANVICEQSPAVITTYNIVKPGIAGQGTLNGTLTAGVVTQGFSGDTNHAAAVNTGSGTSIGSTSLCSTGVCTVGTYRVNVYLDITTACTGSGTYLVSLIYTDDQGSKTIPVNINGTGAVPATGVLTTTSTANFGEVSQIIRSTGAASINYSTTAAACGAGGPMVGKLYLSVEPVQ